MSWVAVIFSYVVGMYIGAEIGFRLGQKFIVDGLRAAIAAHEKKKVDDGKL